MNKCCISLLGFLLLLLIRHIQIKTRMLNTTSGIIAFYSFLFTLPWGLIGHVSSLITFSSRTLRLTSTGFLFICLTLSDVLYLLMSIRDILVQAFSVSILISAHLCRFRSFIINFSATTSSWLLVLIALDRLIRTRFPFQQAQICTRKVAAYSVIVVCICSAVLTSYVLHSEFAYTDTLTNWCGPARSPVTSYTHFYFNVSGILQSFITFIIPICLIILCMIGIYSKVHVQQTTIGTSVRRERLQRQMLIMMISSVACFAICAVPYALHRIIYLRLGTTPTTTLEVSIFSIFLNMNYSYNFYIHCLASKLFREKFIQQSKQLYIWFKRRIRQSNTVIYPMESIT